MNKSLNRCTFLAATLALAATFSGASEITSRPVSRKAGPPRDGTAKQVVGTGNCTGGASLSGWYGMLVSGSKYLAGAVYFNGACGLAGYNTFAATSTGAVVNTSVSGSYNTNADGTITITMNLAGQTPAQTFVVGVSKSTAEAVGIETDSGSVSTIDLQSQLATKNLSYTTASLSGTYSAVCYGSAVDLNYVTFDGNGNLSGVDPYANSGGMGNSPYSGTYVVYPDGTLQASLVGDYRAFSFFGVLDQGSNEIEYIYNLAGQGAVVSCVGKK